MSLMLKLWQNHLHQTMPKITNFDIDFESHLKIRKTKFRPYKEQEKDIKHARKQNSKTNDERIKRARLFKERSLQGNPKDDSV